MRFIDFGSDGMRVGILSVPIVRLKIIGRDNATVISLAVPTGVPDNSWRMAWNSDKLPAIALDLGVVKLAVCDGVFGDESLH